MGLDDISDSIMRTCKEELVGPIHDIIKCAIENSTAPVEWKRAKAVPFYENGGKEEPLIYRPMSLTSVVYKMCERVIKKQWIEFFKR